MESDVPTKHSAEEDLRKLGDAVSLLRKRQRRFRRNAGLEIEEKMRVLLSAHKGSLHFKDGIKRLRFKEVLSATNNFSCKNLITEGPLGKVYKGQLLWDGNLMNFTVRRINCTYGHGEESHTEISTLKRLKHKNIISIFGRCDENNETIIIYEQACHGTLDQHLSDLTLTWSQRLKICLGVARALSYIHYDLIHCDFNSSKILLDEDWEPKIYGFELCTKYPQSWRHRLLYSHYFGTYNMTPKYDIYYFGVLLFEVLCGRKPMTTDDGIPEELIDPNLRKQMEAESLKQFKDLAYKCLNQQLVKHLTMDQVVKELEEVLEFQWKHANLEPSVDDGTPSNNLKMDFLKIPLSEIRLATKNFDKELIVGSGAYGIVYKAKLDVLDIQSLSSVAGKLKDKMPKINKTVAIKQILRKEDEQSRENFSTELELLTSCEHPNIISLLGFSREAHEKILVFEYASKGSLSDYFGNNGKTVNLTWVQRIQICLDIARAVNYLHTDMEGKPRIIHRDIKSDNILLDENMNAKLADFGLSRSHNMFASTICTKYLAGTEFYIDPEYLTTGKYKTKSDIYSFGVVLFEVLSGSLAYDAIYLREDEKGLAPIARRHYTEGTLKELIDPKMIEEDNDHTFTLNRGPNQDSFHTFSEIAYRCLAETQAKRPTMEAVIMELKKALHFQGETMVLSRFRLRDIELATENFAETYCIGLDTNSMVYKAELDHFENVSLLETEEKKNGVPSKKSNTVAIKRITSRKGIHGKQEFFAELEMIAGYKHPNIVSLIGFCDEVDEMILVYDYAPHRSLDDYLKSVDNKDDFTWTHRLRMCLEIARGLNHLHTKMVNQQRMINIDIKSANTLLDKNSEAKIAYFKISKLHPTNQEIDMKVYEDPEYKTATGKLKRKSDVYSFGVVLFEIFSGKLAYDKDYMVENDKGLAPIARQCFTNGTIERIMDPKLKEETEEDISTSNRELYKDSLDTFLKIAYQCLGEASERPTMEIVIKKLEIALNYHASRYL